MQEIWYPIQGYEFYEVSNLGRVRSIDKIFEKGSQRIVKKGKVRKLHTTKQGYAQITLVKDNIPKSFRLHRIVALYFVPNPNNYPDVNHLDGNKLNNRADNLEWTTKSRNQKYSYQILNRVVNKPNLGKFGKDSHSSKTIYMYLDNKFIREYGSVSEAGVDNGVTKAEIKQLCTGVFRGRYRGKRFTDNKIKFSYEKLH